MQRGTNSNDLIAAFVEACLEVFGADRVEGVVLHGSAHKGGEIAGYSDIDFMVFLASDCFDAGGELRDEDVFAFQARIGPLAWREAGYLYPQAYFYDARRLPSWWTGPVPGAYRVLHGELPTAAQPTGDKLRAIEAHFLAEDLPQQRAAMVRNFVDADDASLPRRVRLLGTAVTPALFAVLTLDAEDPLALWALPKFEALALLEARYPGAEGPRLARRFYERMARLYGETFDEELGRAAFRTGVAFLRWAEEMGHAAG